MDNKATKIERNISKIQSWNGNDIMDIVDSLDVIRANGGSYDLGKNVKTDTIVDVVKDVEGIYAVDVNGNILFIDETVGTVSGIVERKKREEMGLAPMDDLLDFVDQMNKTYNDLRSKEIKKINDLGRKTTVNYRVYTESVMILEKVGREIEKTINVMSDS
jgi:hypothetical protein